jgi:hypothetical protein
MKNNLIGKEKLYRDYYKGVIAEDELIKEITEIDLAAKDAQQMQMHLDEKCLKLIIELISPQLANRIR